MNHKGHNDHPAFFFVSFVLLVVPFVVPFVAAQNTDVARGRQLYLKDGCYQCHGRVGQGGAGPHLGPNPPPLDAFVRYVRAPRAEMPPYTERVISDADLADIHAFLRSLPRPAPAIPDLPSGAVAR